MTYDEDKAYDPTPEVSPLEEAHKQVLLQVERLDHAAGLLIERLRGVLRPGDPSETERGDVLAQVRRVSPAVERAEHLGLMISAITDRLQDARDRLDA